MSTTEHTPDAISAEHGFASFREFYPFYLGEHQNTTCRRLHFIGSTGVLVFLALAVFTLNPWWLLAMPLCGYGFAWVGHFFFEKNKPATFQYPLWSLASDFILFWRLLTGQERFRP